MRKLLLLGIAVLLLCGWMGDSWNDGLTTISGTQMKLYTYSSESLADDGSFNLPTSSDGIGIAKCDTQDMVFGISIDGEVVITGNTTFTAADDTDGYFCIFDGGDGFATVKNRLQSAKKIRVIYYYN